MTFWSHNLLTWRPSQRLQRRVVVSGVSLAFALLAAVSARSGNMWCVSLFIVTGLASAASATVAVRRLAGQPGSLNDLFATICFVMVAALLWQVGHRFAPIAIALGATLYFALNARASSTTSTTDTLESPIRASPVQEETLFLLIAAVGVGVGLVALANLYVAPQRETGTVVGRRVVESETADGFPVRGFRTDIRVDGLNFAVGGSGLYRAATTGDEVRVEFTPLFHNVTAVHAEGRTYDNRWTETTVYDLLATLGPGILFASFLVPGARRRLRVSRPLRVIVGTGRRPYS